MDNGWTSLTLDSLGVSLTYVFGELCRRREAAQVGPLVAVKLSESKVFNLYSIDHASIDSD